MAVSASMMSASAGMRVQRTASVRRASLRAVPVRRVAVASSAAAETLAAERDRAERAKLACASAFAAKAQAAKASAVAAAAWAATAAPAAACAAAPAVAVGADTAWILCSTALVLFMTIPGLSAFYGGIVKRKNVLSVLMQCFAITCIVSVLWYAVGYSLCFSTAGMVEGQTGLGAFIGGLDKVFLAGVTKESLQGTIPEALWALFQMTFAVITPALMIGSFVERMKFNALMYYVVLWMFAVYFPACHMVWGGAGSFFGDLGVIDFAGGIVVHITAGMGALIGCMELGARKDNRMVPGNLPLTAIGTGMLWVGWYGFNGGSAVAAGADAAFACLATQLAAATAACVWTAQDVLQTGKATLLGACTGSIAGLATVTPAAGVVGPLGAVCLGAAAGIICRYFSLTVKEKVGYDDSLDVVGVHGVGGFIGTILLSIFGSAAFGGFNPVPVSTQLPIQVFAAVTTALYTGAASYICLKIADKLAGGLRAPADAEDSGMDAYSHGEAAITLSAEETR